MKNTEYIDELLARYFANESLTSAQGVDLEEWRVQNQALFDQLQTLSAELSTASDIEFDSEKAWNIIEPELSTKRQLSWYYRTIGIAASILLAIGFSLSWYFQNETQTLQYANTTMGQRKVVLPDHSTITIYPGASVEYTAGKKRGSRILSLKGQAFFTVRKLDDRPFIVEAYNTRIKVLGTSFFVDAIAANHTDVKVKTGKVSVTSNEKNVILTAGEQVMVTGNSMITEPLSPTQDATESKPVILKFNKTPILKVIKILEENFNVTIRIDPALKDNTITTVVSTDNLESILTELSYLSKCKYRKTADKQYELYVE